MGMFLARMMPERLTRPLSRTPTPLRTAPPGALARALGHPLTLTLPALPSHEHTGVKNTSLLRARDPPALIRLGTPSPLQGHTTQDLEGLAR